MYLQRLVISFLYYIMYTSVPYPGEIIASFTNPTLQKVLEGDYNGYLQTQKELKKKLAGVFTQRGGGQYGHMGNILSNYQYSLILINTLCVVTPEPGLLLVIAIGLATVQLGNLVRAHR